MVIIDEVKLEFTKLGLHIKQLREDRNIDITELSSRTDIRKEYLKKIEKGTAYGVMIERHLIKIAETLDIKLFELFDYE